jgi:hypothetical protein
MEDKKEYLRDIAKEHWEYGQPFSSDDFRLFQRLCKEDGFDVDGKDWSYYWECYEDCRYNDNVQNYDMEDLTEAAGEKNARRRVWGSSWIEEYTGVSNLDFFGEYLLDEIKSNLESLTCNVGGKQRMAIDMDRTEISIDKDPAPNESVKERRIRGWVYFNSNFNVIMEDRQILKQKTIQAFKAGMADFNDKYKMDYLVCKDMVLLSKSFKYGNDNKSMYFVFKAEEEKFHNERPQTVIVHKHSRESKEDLFESILHENATSFNLEDLNELKTAFYNLANKCEKEDYDYRIKYVNVSLVYLDKVCRVAEAPDDVECYHEDDDVVAVFDSIGDRHFEDLPEKNYIGVLFDYQAQDANPYNSFMKKLKRNNFINRFCRKYHLVPFYNICCRDRNGGDFLENFEEFVRDNYSVFNIPFEPGIDVVAIDPYFGDEITIFEGRE